jgi:putative nucleotidyltransferase with HDIG domain
MEEKLNALLPELKLIGDAALRGKVVAVYEAALTRGGWTPDDMATIPFTLLIEPCPASYLEHVRGVTRAALAIAETMAGIYGERFHYDQDVLVAGALLHDVGKLVEYGLGDGKRVVKSPTGKMLRHPFTGAALCLEFGLPDTVSHVVATHAKEGDGARATPEAVIIHHADFANFETFKL